MNEDDTIKGNEVAVIGVNYGVFAEYILHNHTNPITSRFKEIDFSTWDKFFGSFYETSNQPEILDISYEQAIKNFASFETTLKSYGLLPSKDDSTKVLNLTYNSNYKSGSYSKVPLLKFSGYILLRNNLFIENMSVVFDEVEFIDTHKIFIKDTSPYNNIVYLRNTHDVSHLELSSISSLWISGSARLGKLSFEALERSNFGINCDVNIAPDSTTRVKEALEIKEINCINIGGALRSHTDINIAFATGGGELHLKSNAALIAPSSKITISRASKVTAVNNGDIVANAIYYGAGSLYNNGTIFITETGTISVTKLFNYKAGRLISNKLKICTIKAFYNIGEIKSAELIVSAPSEDLPSGIIYNNGNITTGKFNVTSKTHFLNHKNGFISSANKLDWRLTMDWFNREYSQDILNSGDVGAKSVNVDLNSVINVDGSFKIAGEITGTLQYIKCVNSQCEAAINLQNPLNIYVKDSQTTFVLENGQKIGEVVIGDLPQTTQALPASAVTPNDITNLSILSSNSSLRLIGNATIEALFIGQKGKFIVGDELNNLMDNGVVNISNLAINSLYMIESALLATTSNGRVFVGTMTNNGGQIESLGNVTVSAWNLQGNVTLKGNINGPAITEPVNLAINNAYLAIDVGMFNKGLTTVIGDAITIFNTFIRGIISGKIGLKNTILNFVVKTTLDMVVKFVGSHHFTYTQATSQSKIDLKRLFELDLAKMATIDSNAIMEDKIKIKSGNKVIIMPTSLYKKIYAHWDSDSHPRTEETISSLISELTGENGIEIFSNTGRMLYSWKSKSTLPIILNAGEIVSISGVSESSKINYYTSWSKQFCDLIKKVASNL